MGGLPVVNMRNVHIFFYYCTKYLNSSVSRNILYNNTVYTSVTNYTILPVFTNVLFFLPQIMFYIMYILYRMNVHCTVDQYSGNVGWKIVDANIL